MLLPEVAIIPSIVDGAGVPSVGIVFRGTEEEWAILVNPKDGQFAGEQRRMIVPNNSFGLPVGTVTESTAVRVSVVDEAPVETPENHR
ncbi:MAG: hypothetical protein ACJ72N_00050 [Labedaea sp.]